MNKNGIKYQPPCVLIVGKNDDEDLIFANVTDVFICDKTVLFGVEILNSKFCYHYHAFALSIRPSSIQQRFNKDSSLNILIYCITIRLECTIVPIFHQTFPYVTLF